jgi:hypothetical protein
MQSREGWYQVPHEHLLDIEGITEKITQGAHLAAQDKQVVVDFVQSIASLQAHERAIGRHIANGESKAVSNFVEGSLNAALRTLDRTLDVLALKLSAAAKDAIPWDDVRRAEEMLRIPGGGDSRAIPSMAPEQVDIVMICVGHSRMSATTSPAKERTESLPLFQH